MQVRKFEARTMREALEMVKAEMGPDAIILGVKDHKRSFGLVGDGSIEITAAVSENTLQKKKFVESRIREQDRKIMANSSAKVQREFTNKMVDNHQRAQIAAQPKAPEAQAAAPRSPTRTRYIEIADEVDGMALAQDPASERIRGAAQRAWNAMNEQVPSAVTESRFPQAAIKAALGNGARVQSPDAPDVRALREEIAGLKQLVRSFQQVPQTMTPVSAPVTAHPGADFGLGYEVSFMFEKLVKTGVAAEIAAEILTQAQKHMAGLKLKNKALVDAWVAKFILDTTKIAPEKNAARIQVFLGPSGSGKTSTMVKLASHLVVNEKKKIALLTSDTLKVGAAEQLKIYSQILNVPFGMIRNSNDWSAVLQQLSQFDQVLVDSPGLSLKSLEENSFLRNVMPPKEMSAVHLVMNTTSKDSDLTEMGNRFKGHGFQDVIFTNLDLSVHHGGIYNFMKRFDMPLHSFGIGTRVPEDYEMATKERVLDLLFKLTSLRKL